MANKLHELMTGQNFSISLKNFEKIFFAGNVLKHKVKPKNSRNSTFFKKLKFPPYFWKTLVKFSSPKCSLWYAVIFLSPREGKFKQKNNQLFSWLKKEGKTEASACLIDWPVGPVSANQECWIEWVRLLGTVINCIVLYCIKHMRLNIYVS